MRWGSKSPKAGGRRGAPERVVPDSTAALSAAAREEARKGTAAADPVIGLTPEGQALPGAVVDGEFVAAADAAARPDRGAPPEGDVAADERPGENEEMKNVRWGPGGARG